MAIDKFYDIGRNIDAIKVKILDACKRSNRSIDSVKLIAVSKTVSPEFIKVAYEHGIKDFGENYVQEMSKKVELLPRDIRWHFIGHLQTNKIKYLIKIASLIHTVYKVEHLLEVEKRCEKLGITAELLIEVNIGNEVNKSGIPPSKVEELVKKSLDFKYLKIKGLMCIPPIGGPEETRKFFKNLRFIKDCINNNLGSELLTELSMGMSSDFEVAIEEGATMIRIGTAIFGERKRGGYNEDESN
ncbi:MAG: YggS family pyridoxal phosphate-dependent enzyme [Deltaproteobacteria bacterium]|nr:YggS family pyridoxal phosphate-dependent enzyme [Deltaproteobacteria bacterium]